MQKSLIEIAFEYIEGQKNPVPFSKIWEYVKATAGLSEEEAQKKSRTIFH